MLRSHLETIKRTASSFRNTLKYIEIIHWSTLKCIYYNARHKAFQIIPNISKPCAFDYVLYSIIIGTDSTCVPNFKCHEAMTSAGGPISTMQPSSKRRRRSKCCKRDFSGCVTTMRVLELRDAFSAKSEQADFWLGAAPTYRINTGDTRGYPVYHSLLSSLRLRITEPKTNLAWNRCC